MRRFGVLLAVAVASATAFGGATKATAQTGVATLTGEELVSCARQPVLGFTFGCVNVNETGPTTSFRLRARCTERIGTTGSTGTMSWTVSGLALGPYPGTFTETGTVHFTNGVVTSLEANFHIESATAVVDGRKFAPTATGDCTFFRAAGGNVWRPTVLGDARYEAIIKPATGGSFADEGTTNFIVAGLTVSNPTVAEAEATTGLFFEQFVSDLLFAQQLLPDAKEQCKDEGFVIFGVFENQGDCVSFVATNGKNEPGKNEPTAP